MSEKIRLVEGENRFSGSPYLNLWSIHLEGFQEKNQGRTPNTKLLYHNHPLEGGDAAVLKIERFELFNICQKKSGPHPKY